MLKAKMRSEVKRFRRAISACRGEFGALSLAEVAAALRLPIREVRDMISTGKLIGVRIGGEPMIPKSELRRQLSL
jgi:hypothetical protein